MKKNYLFDYYDLFKLHLIVLVFFFQIFRFFLRGFSVFLSIIYLSMYV